MEIEKAKRNNVQNKIDRIDRYSVLRYFKKVQRANNHVTNVVMYLLKISTITLKLLTTQTHS